MSLTTTAVRQPARRGRPCGRGVKRWHGEAVARVVRDALAARDVDDPESVTEATYRLCEAVAALRGRPLQAPETQCLRRLVATARPSAIIRVVHGWERPHHGPGRSGACDAGGHQRTRLGLTGRPSLSILYTD